MPSSRKRNTLFTLLTIILLAPYLSAQTDAFVQRAGTKLTLNSAPFRYSGPNIEWLGLEGYGPHDPMGPRLPSHYPSRVQARLQMHPPQLPKDLCRDRAFHED